MNYSLQIAGDPAASIPRRTLDFPTAAAAKRFYRDTAKARGHKPEAYIHYRGACMATIWIHDANARRWHYNPYLS